MTWQERLRAAGGVTPELGAEMDKVIHLIEGALAGEIDPSLLRAVLGPAADDDARDHPPIVVALERLAQDAATDVPAKSREAFWDALRELPRLLRELSYTLYGTPLSLADRPYSFRDRLRRLTEREHVRESASFRCPRCRSRAIDGRREKALGVVTIEVKCTRCGLSDSLEEDDAAHNAPWTANAAS